MWTLLFGLPHIVASLQTSCDREYLAQYGDRLWGAAGLLFLPLGLHVAGVPQEAILGAFVVLTVHHVIAQQFGIALAGARLSRTPLSEGCRWILVVLGTVAYLQAYGGLPWRGDGAAALNALKAPALALSAAFGAALVWRARAQGLGSAMLGLNLVMFVASLMLIFYTRFGLVGLVLVRVLHDLTGFLTYLRHDLARNRAVRKNLLYRLFPFLPVLLLAPLLAVAIAAALGSLASLSGPVGWLLIGLNLVHYYTESFTWRRDSPHRRSFNLSGT